MNNFIDDYVQYASKMTASPLKFHRMMAYSLLAQVIGRRPLFQRSGPPIGPNLWVLILAPSSTMAKSSALSIGKRILYNAYNESHDHIIPTGGSTENFFERLESNPSGIMFASEFAGLMQWFNKSYANDISSLLLEAYDQGASIQKSIGTNHKGNKKTYIIRHPYINAYAVSSYDLFNSVMTQSTVTGGFLSRWLIVREDASGNFKPFTEPINESKEIDLAQQLRDVLLQDNLNINFEYEPKAAKIYEEWIKDYLEPTTKSSAHSLVTAYCQRRVVDLHKLGIIHAILRGSPGKIDFEDTDQAITIVQESIKDAIFLIDNKLSLSKEEGELNRIMEYIVSFGPYAPRWKVMKYSKVQAFQFDRYIQTLESMKKIVVSDKGKEGLFYVVSFHAE